MKVFLSFAAPFLIFVLSECSKDVVFRKNKQKYLANHVIETKKATSEFECGLLCARHESCASANFKTSGEDKGRCELNEKPMQATTDDDERANHEFNHLLIIKEKPLDSTPGNSPTLQQSTTCSHVDWSQSFDIRGWSNCGEENLFITGFYRGPPNSDGDPITLLEKAKCCKAIPKASCKACSGQNSQCQRANWWFSFDRNNNWNVCPVGYFLNGLYRTAGGHVLHEIEEGYCCKPSNHPDQYGSCYDEDVGSSFNQGGWSNCSKAGYYITGLYRGSGDNWLNNIDKFRCCQIA